MVKVITFFLIGMVVLAMFGKLRLPGNPLGKGARRGAARIARPAKCSTCGRHIIGKGPCPCQQPRNGKT
ncbi:MAG: hypothetical protein H5U19_10415 [Rhodobacteraceae bacterium]|jgi:hypothetical protein|nr:hypothetical protein [Paracoccaceae bacterium]